jgi:hypothetical protein
LEGSGKPDGLILNGTYQLLVCADNVTILDGTVRTSGEKNGRVFIRYLGDWSRSKC